METGEPLLFYRNGTGRFTARGRIGAMCETEFIRDEFWAGGPAISIYEVREYHEDVQLTLKRAKSMLDYDAGFILRGTHRVSDERPTDRLINHVWNGD